VEKKKKKKKKTVTNLAGADDGEPTVPQDSTGA